MLRLKNTILALSLGTMLTTGYAVAYDLPIGDGNVTSYPAVGSVYSCQTAFSANAGGAQATGDWFDAASGTWDPDLKPIIDGSVSWPSEIEISIVGDQRIITGNGLPDHTTGNYPVASNDDAFQYDRNPNNILAQDVLLRLDTSPEIADSPSCVPMGMIGFATSGAAIFNALDGLGRDAAAHEIQDACSGHPERSGEYHYHDLSDCLVDTQSGPDGHSDLLGYALDGFGIYGLYEESGAILTTADLDVCHGHVGEVEWDGELVEMYHYHFTEDYPYTLGCFVGDVSGASQTTIAQNGPDGLGGPEMAGGPVGPGNQGFGGQTGPAGPVGPGGQGGPNSAGGQIIALVAADLNVSVDALRQAVGSPPPDFRQAAEQLGLSEQAVRTAFEAARQQVGI